MAAANLFADIPQDLPQEQIEELAASPAVRIERIVSRGQASPEGFCRSTRILMNGCWCSRARPGS